MAIDFEGNQIGLPTSDFPAQDYIMISFDKSPGKATIVSANSPRGWQVMKSPYVSGAALVPTGDEPARFDIMFELWTAEHLKAWRYFAAAYFDKSVRFEPGTIKPVALSISHPILNAAPLRITSAVIVGATALMNDGYGLYSCVVSFLQYRAPIPAAKRPDASLQEKQKAAPKAQDAADRTIVQLEAEVAQQSRRK